MTTEQAHTPLETIVKELRHRAAVEGVRLACAPSTLVEYEAADRLEKLSKLDQEAATYVETVLCMRTHFTGEQPYVGWKGLGLALTETLDRLEACEAALREIEAETESVSQPSELNMPEEDFQRAKVRRVHNIARKALEAK